MGESGHSNRIETERALTGRVGHREPGRAAGRLSSKMTYQASGHLALEQDISAPEAVPANHPGLAEATDGTFVSSRWPEPMAGADQPGTARVLSGTVCVRDGMAYRVSPRALRRARQRGDRPCGPRLPLDIPGPRQPPRGVKPDAALAFGPPPSR